MSNVAVLSCWFGHKFNIPIAVNTLADLGRWLKAVIKNILPYYIFDFFGRTSIIPKAPKGVLNCYFYSNNLKLKAEIINRGWSFCYIKEEVCNGESIKSSVLAKKVKFLQVHDYILDSSSPIEHVIYMDSRRICDNIASILQANSKGVLVRYEARYKPTVWHEVDDALGQERYAKNMNKTIDFIHTKIKQGYTANNRVMNTGIIAYNFESVIVKRNIMTLCNEVYNVCVELEQPECQIFWCILSQCYSDILQTVEFSVIKSRTGL